MTKQGLDGLGPRTVSFRNSTLIEGEGAGGTNLESLAGDGRRLEK